MRQKTICRLLIAQVPGDEIEQERPKYELQGLLWAATRMAAPFSSTNKKENTKMEHIFISFCEEANFRSTNQELLSGTVSIDFNEGILFFCDSPLPEVTEMPHNSTAYICCGLPAIQLMKQILENWLAHDTKANITKHFRSNAAFKKWRKTVGFSDDELLWQVYIRDDDGGLDVLLSFGPCLPQALQDVFSLAQSLHNS